MLMGDPAAMSVRADESFHTMLLLYKRRWIQGNKRLVETLGIILLAIEKRGLMKVVADKSPRFVFKWQDLGIWEISAG